MHSCMLSLRIEGNVSLTGKEATCSGHAPKTAGRQGDGALRTEAFGSDGSGLDEDVRAMAGSGAQQEGLKMVSGR